MTDKPAPVARCGIPAEGAIPAAQWDRAPWNRHTFQHVREFLPTATVARGLGPVTPLPAALRDLGGIRFEADGAAQSVAGWLESSDTDGFLVAHRGVVVTECYGNGMTAHTPHLAQSVSKSIVASVAGILAGRGLLDPAAPVTRYLPELQATAYRGASVQQVLDMTSGVLWDESSYEALDSDVARMDAASGWKARSDPTWPRCMWELIATLTRAQGPHGAQFRYRSIETDVLGFILQRAGGLPLAELVGRELWAPLGAEDDAYFTVDPAGFACACGGFNATLRDFARFALMLAGGGELAGRRVVPREWITATRAGDPALFPDSYRDVLPHGAYRNQFWLEEPVTGPFMARGVFGQLIYVDPEAQFAAVKLSSWPEFLSAQRARTALAALHAIRAALGVSAHADRVRA